MAKISSLRLRGAVIGIVMFQ